MDNVAAETQQEVAETIAKGSDDLPIQNVDANQSGKAVDAVDATNNAVVKEGSNLAIRNDIVLAGGRSGGNVKNLKGPVNSVVKGNNGRIYITDDVGNVIWDISNKRAKQVIPGKGFGPKSTPTQEQLNLLNQIWGN